MFDAIMFDVDNKDSSVGMSCPPAAFVESSVLNTVRSLLSPRGTDALVPLILRSSVWTRGEAACGVVFFMCLLLMYDKSSVSSSRPGVFMLNLVCRDSALRKSVLERVRRVFSTILTRKIEGEVNEVLLCTQGGNEASDSALPRVQRAARSLQGALCHNGTGGSRSPHIDIAELLKDLKVV